MQTGIVHFGPGAFHRAHQAAYIDSILAADPRWGIAAVALRSPGTVAALKAQDGRYTLAILDAETQFRTLRAHNRFFGPGESRAVRALLRDPGVRIVSSTVTEKGYCLAGDGILDFAHPDIIHDLAAPEDPVSIVGWLFLGFKDRREAGLPAFTPLCCDNMVSNGKKLRAALLAYAERLDPSLARWIEAEAVFPDTMVDSITPATDDRLRARVAAEIGYEDAVPVSREAYTFWVIEDVLPEGLPDFESVGVVLAEDVGAWERAKLRILNGAHSSLAYLGLLIGHETVADAMADAELSGFVEALIRTDIIPSLEPSPLDLQSYAGEILGRFRNPAIGHKLAQIAWDGSQKLPYRLLDTIADARRAGRSVERLAVPIAAWILFVQRQARAGAAIVDPLAPRLAEVGVGEDAAERLLALDQVFPAELAGDSTFREAVLSAVAAMRQEGPRARLAPIA
ncbi:mannitol dehydrogenase family protein [Sphingosinicella sp. BN140058]|uniref:mannitol dehydrogenase family protein n=1 Tax=Sphingosinicella sp. BN140058 TaxID=1892855 RepID=UPI001012485B|nr:mannitol dehydrogenase family protein [Sphingosinicella sp. BN140058]QAY76018.1 mannitol dehydrogenase family protein [Sphingosinicella sp. BN140058]